MRTSPLIFRHFHRDFIILLRNSTSRYHNNNIIISYTLGLGYIIYYISKPAGAAGYHDRPPSRLQEESMSCGGGGGNVILYNYYNNIKLCSVSPQTHTQILATKLTRCVHCTRYTYLLYTGCPARLD